MGPQNLCDSICTSNEESSCAEFMWSFWDTLYISYYFRLYLGRDFVVILGDYEAVKEAFSKSTTTDRPENTFNLLPDGFGKVFAFTSRLHLR